MDFEALLHDEDTTGIVAEEHWARRGDIDLYMFRKFSPDARARFPGRRRQSTSTTRRANAKFKFASVLSSRAPSASRFARSLSPGTARPR